MLKFLSEQEQKRFHELQAKLASLEIGQDEHAELNALVNQARHSNNQRSLLVNRLKADIAAANVHPLEVYSPEQIRAITLRNHQSQDKSPKAAKSRAISRADKLKSLRGKPLIRFAAKSVGPRIKFFKGQQYATYVPKLMKELEAAGTLEASLKANMTPEGAAYFVTPEGTAEFSNLLKMIKTKSARPE